MSTRHLPGSGRAEILAAATQEFADLGYSGATTAGIARRAGVTQPLVHHHFGSKQGLWDAVLEQLFQELHDVIQRASSEVQGADRTTRLAHLLRAFISFSGHRPELSRLIRSESHSGGEGFKSLFEGGLTRHMAFLHEEISAAVEEGVIRPVDSRLAWFAIMGACTQLFAQPEAARHAFGLDVKDERTISQYADFVVEQVLHGLLAEPLPPRTSGSPARRKTPARKSPAARRKPR